MFDNGALVFPRIEYLQDGELRWSPPARQVKLQTPDGLKQRRSPTRKKPVRLYRLSWAPFDAELQRRREHRESRRVYLHEGERPHGHEVALPEKYEAMVANAVFAIAPDYMREARRNAARANEEWAIERSFDTVIREECLLPAIAHTRVAFRLLDDCLFDLKASYWTQHETAEKALLYYAMLYKFWRGQTGGGIDWHHAELDWLEDRIGRIWPNRGEVYEEAVAFLAAVEKRREAGLPRSQASKAMSSGT